MDLNKTNKIDFSNYEPKRNYIKTDNKNVFLLLIGSVITCALLIFIMTCGCSKSKPTEVELTYYNGDKELVIVFASKSQMPTLKNGDFRALNSKKDFVVQASLVRSFKIFKK